MNKFILTVFLLVGLTTCSKTPQESTSPKEENKTVESADTIILNARNLYAEMNEFAEQLTAKIEAVDKVRPQIEGEGFLHGLKEVTADGGKSYVFINENVMWINAGKNGARMALETYDALPHKPTAHDQAQLATEFMFETDMFFFGSEKPTRAMIEALRVVKLDEVADDMEKKYDNLKTHSLTMRLKMYSLVKDYLEKTNERVVK